jgi:RNA polymerase sigma-70 factor, ECF subfamily
MRDNLSTPSTHVSLLARIRNTADAVSWELFVRTYGMAVYHFCRRRGLQESDSVDLVQEVLVQVMISIRTFDYNPNRGRFRDWLGAVTRSKLARFWRATARQDQLNTAIDPDKIGAQGIDPDWTTELDAQLLRTALEVISAAFDPTNWKAFERTWIHNESAAIVAEELGIPVAQVYVAKSRISKRLADELSHLSDDIPWLTGPS